MPRVAMDQAKKIREHITPKGDGNKLYIILLFISKRLLENI